MVVGVDAAATGNYGQDITIAIVIAIGAAVPLSVLLVCRPGRGAGFYSSQLREEYATDGGLGHAAVQRIKMQGVDNPDRARASPS